MDYISTKEAAEKWGVSMRHVQRLLHENRIVGARKYGVSWMIPADTDKPDDPRSVPSPARQAEVGSSIRTDSAEALFPLLYLHGGDIAGAYARCHNDAERTLLDAQLAYIRGDARLAYSLVLPVYRSAKEMRIRIACELSIGVYAMRFGDAAAWKNAISSLSELRVHKDMRMERDLAMAAMRAWLHGRAGYPEWLEIGAFGMLPPELFPLARWIYAVLLYTKWKEVDLLAVIEPMIAECRREKSDIAEIYLRLHAAIAYYDHGRKEMTNAHIKAAIELAKPYGCIEPFIDNHYHITRPMDESFSAHWPEALAPVKRQVASFWDGWSKVYNSVWDISIFEQLTLREKEACSLFSRGMFVSEIAKRMGISKSSVQKYISTAYQKLGVNSKEELRKFIHT